VTFALAHVPLMRLLRTRRGWVPLALWTVVAVVSALLMRSRVGSAADQVLRGTYGFIVLPLVAYGIVGAALGGAGLRGAIRGIVGLGASPREASLAAIGVASLSSAVAGAVLAALVCVVAHGPSDAPLLHDLLTSTWIGALGGVAYAAYFSAGSAIGRGTMRGAFLVLDWIVGVGAGAGSLLTPRGHVQSLLGGPLAAELPQRASSGLLVVLTLGYAALAVALSRRP
jgi:hypothetical protein